MHASVWKASKEILMRWIGDVDENVRQMLIALINCHVFDISVRILAWESAENTLYAKWITMFLPAHARLVFVAIHSFNAKKYHLYVRVFLYFLIFSVLFLT